MLRLLQLVHSMLRRAPYSPVIEIDDDSHSKFIADSSRAKSQMEGEGEDNETKRENFRHGELIFLTVYALIKRKLNFPHP